MALILAFVLAGGTLAHAAQRNLKPNPIQWCLATKPGMVVRTKPGGDDKVVAKLTRGTLLPAYEIKKTSKGEWLRVVVVDLAVMTPRSGWLNSADVEVLAAGEFPHDDILLALSGSPFLEDFSAENTAVSRLLLRTRNLGTVLICYMGTEVLPQARLQMFTKSGARFKAGPYIDFPFSEMKSPIASLEARDMAGDGNEFLILHEPFQAGPMHFGMNMVIRRVEGPSLTPVGKIPISIRNFASYPPRLDIAEPGEANIGRPGTDTKGTVEFRLRGPLTDIAWRGEVRFHVLGREKPLETIPLERVWTWDGAQFKPSR